MKGLRATKNVKAIRFEGVWDKLESARGFQGQQLTGYFRLALVFVWGGTGRGEYHWRGFHFGGGAGRWALGAGLSCYGVWALSGYFLIC